MLYPLVRPLLFKLEPEFSHQLTIKILSKLQNVPGFFPDPKYHDEPVTCFGLTFPNRIGLAAGLDKNAECVKAWQSMGFGFVEVGTVTPLAQLGNEKPRLFRLRQDKAIINRLGFNNAGIDKILIVS